MSERALEEIECEIKRDTAYMEPWRANPELIRHAQRLLAIAREQRGAIAADEDRTKAAAMRAWGEHVRGCDTAAAMADLIAAQRVELSRRPRFGSCVWVSLDADMDARIWSTGCKQEWVFHAGSPQENGVKFCPHCGAEAEIEMSEDSD